MAFMVIEDKVIPRLDEVPDGDVVDIVDHVLAVARKTSGIDSEREKFDFKTFYGRTSKDEICRDFSSFANWNGGLLIDGVDDHGNVKGVTSPLPDKDLRNILSTQNSIKQKPDYVFRKVDYHGLGLVVYQIFESPVQIEVYYGKHNRWYTYRRYGSSKRPMNEVEVMLKWYPGVRRVPEYARLRLDSAAFYSTGSTVFTRYVEWKTLEPDNLYRMIELPYRPVTFVPIPAGALSSPELYSNVTRWNGPLKSFVDSMIVETERVIQQVGIVYECWTTTTDHPKRVDEPHTYRTGIDAQALQESLPDLVARHRYANFGWVIISGGPTIYVMGGMANTERASIALTAFIPFIPNNFPLVYLDESGAVKAAPLPVHTTRNPISGSWKSPTPSNLFLQDPPEDELVTKPPARIDGYLGPRPDPKTPEMPLGTRGLTVISVDQSDRKQLEGVPAELNPILCNITTYPFHLNDSQKIRLVGHSSHAYSFPNYGFDFHLVLFNICCDINQQKALKS